tara:strand:+ start:219 stop:419 length:201 start_codon:yes stop_codon:yes gene_type:complete
MKTHHNYPSRIKVDYWEDLLSVQKFTTKSINTLLNEGVREVVKKTKQELGQYRKDRNSIRSVASLE